jgi:hypothetical protein
VIEQAVQLGAALGAMTLGWRFTGQHTAETPIDRRIGGIGWGVVGLWLLMQWMARFAPVVVDMRAPIIERGPAWVVMAVSADKVRPECVFEYSRATVIDAGGRQAKAWWEALNDPAPGSSRPAGAQWMGDWRVRWDGERFKPQYVVFESHHDCGMLMGRMVSISRAFPLSGAIVGGVD